MASQVLPDKKYFMRRKIPKRDYIISDFIGEGANGYVFKVESDTLGVAACKILVDELNRSSWKDEVRNPNALNDECVVRFKDYVQCFDESAKVNLVYLISEYIDGQSLKVFLKKRKKKIPMEFVHIFETTMLRLLHRLDQKESHHGDLHSGNIIVKEVSEDEFEKEPYQFKVTDFGVSSLSEELLDDFTQVGVILEELLANVKYQELTSHWKFCWELYNNHILKVFSDCDPTRNNLFRKPNLIYRYIVDELLKFKSNDNDIKLNTPYDYLSCEQIASESLFKDLYSSKFLGMNKIISKNNLILTGPRGCGKSTIFKSLSLKYLSYADKDKPSEIKFVGVYFHCRMLGFVFPNYRPPENLDNTNYPVHYFTAALLTELIVCLEPWLKKHFPESRHLESEIAALVFQEIGMERHDNFQYSFAHLKQVLNKEASKIRTKQTYKHIAEPGSLWGPETLSIVLDIFTEKLTFLRNTPFCFFIDDYSMPKISSDLQKNLNRIFMQRLDNVFFKISTESPVSFINVDLDGKGYVESREYLVSNLGITFLRQNESEMRDEFISDVFQKRFRLTAGYPAKNLDDLLGSNPTSQNEMARKLQDSKKRDSIYWGKEVLFRLCSGDIFYLIKVLGKMDAATDPLDSNNAPLIPKKKQHDVIIEAAGELLESLSGIDKGDLLREMIINFGNVAKEYLKNKKSGNDGKEKPYQANNFEILEAKPLSEDAQEIYNELLRYSLFIEDTKGLGRRGNWAPTMYLKRCLIPYFKLTFSKRDSIRVNSRQVESLLLRPQEFKHEFVSKMKNDDGSSSTNPLPFE